MNNSVCVLVILIGAFALSTSTTEESTISAKILVVDNVNDFLRDNPGVTLTKMDSRRTPQEVLYTMGERQEEDRLVGTFKNSASFEPPQDVLVMLKYPANGGQGAVVTHVSVVVDRTSDLGNGYVFEVGVGHRSVSVLLEAFKTQKLSYVAEVYGL